MVSKMLKPLGFSQVEDQIYAKVLENPGKSIDWYAEVFDTSQMEFKTECQALLASGLLIVNESGVFAVPLSNAIELIIARQEASIAKQQAQVAEQRAYARALLTELSAHNVNEVEIVEGYAAVKSCLDRIQDETEKEITIFAPGGGHSPDAIEAAQESDTKLHNRGVVTRTVLLASVKQDVGTMKYAEWLCEQGSAVRVVSKLPTRLLISDQKVAVIPRGSNALDGIAVYHNKLTVNALQDLFEKTWDSASPIGPTPTPKRSGLTDRERAVFELVARGYTNKAIASKLAIADRTVGRILEDVANKLGLKSRIEVVYYAAKNNWI